MRRSHIEAYTCQLEQAGRSRAHRGPTAGHPDRFYRYVVQKGTLPHSPVAHVRRPEEAVRFLAVAQAG